MGSGGDGLCSIYYYLKFFFNDILMCSKYYFNV